jgi:hypothetical protein
MDLGNLTWLFGVLLANFPLAVLPRKSAVQLIDTFHIFLISSGYTQSGSSRDALAHRDSIRSRGLSAGRETLFSLMGSANSTTDILL